MRKCPECGFENREQNKFCTHCGNVLKISDEYIRKEEAKSKTATKNFFVFFFIGLGGCILFGGALTYLTSRGTIIADISAQVATPYIVVGFLLMAIGFGIYLIRTEAQSVTRCNKCGFENEERKWYCAKCGEPLVERKAKTEISYRNVMVVGIIIAIAIGAYLLNEYLLQLLQ